MIKLNESWNEEDVVYEKSLPKGFSLLGTLRGHRRWIGKIKWSNDGKLLASPSGDGTIRIWDMFTGECVRTLAGHKDCVMGIDFHPDGQLLISGSIDHTIKYWDLESGKCVKTLSQPTSPVISIAFHPSGKYFLTMTSNKLIQKWDTKTGGELRTFSRNEFADYTLTFSPDGNTLVAGSSKKSFPLWNMALGRESGSFEGHPSRVYGVTFQHDGKLLASYGHDNSIKLWKLGDQRLVRSLEVHTSSIISVSFDHLNHFLASKSLDNTIRIWDARTGACLTKIEELTFVKWLPGLAFHPSKSILATVGSDPNASNDDCDQVIHILEYDTNVLLGVDTSESVRYCSAKAVLVGDSGVGKTGLGWRLAHGEFKDHPSTHGQQFWMLAGLSQNNASDTQCETVLWDLAGQPDYRLIHALFVDDADIALILFDPTRSDDPLAGVEYWLKKLNAGTKSNKHTQVILVSARCDRGDPRLTEEEITAFCNQNGIRSYFLTSAMSGKGIKELIEELKISIPWEDKHTTVTTKTFKYIKTFVLNLKETQSYTSIIIKPEDLRLQLIKENPKQAFDDSELMAAIGHMETHGYVTMLTTSNGNERILLAPEVLNNLAASIILESRRNEKGLGSLEERNILERKIKFPELQLLNIEDQDILLDSAMALFLKHNICFRETDPLNGNVYLVFPELINLRKPNIDDEKLLEDGVSYTITGSIDNVYASLVVLMGYTHTFTRTNQWRNQARYEVGGDKVCGFRLEDGANGELTFVLYFSTDTPNSTRMLFQSLFESFLGKRSLNVARQTPVICPEGHHLERSVVSNQVARQADFAFCSQCGAKVTIQLIDDPLQLTGEVAQVAETNHRHAKQRSLFEQVLFRLNTRLSEERGELGPECFISYAWGEHELERWVELELATDLQKAGVQVLLDKWDNSRIGSSVPRFIERIETCDHVIVVGTPLYKHKYSNNETMGGYIVASEGDLIGNRLTGTESDKSNIYPILVEGNPKSSFPGLLQGRVYADFTDSNRYFETAFNLLLTIFKIHPRDQIAIELKDMLIEDSNLK